MIDFAKLIDISYWFNPGPGDLGDAFLYFFLTLFGLFVVLMVLLRGMGRQYIRGLHKSQQIILHRIEMLLLTLGLLGLFWVFMRYELVPFFSARFWVALWFLALIVWGYLIFHYACYQVPELVRLDKERQARQRYAVRRGRK